MNLTPSVYEIRTTNTTQNIVVGALRAPTNEICIVYSKVHEKHIPGIYLFIL
jgi:hypothetical protein